VKIKKSAFAPYYIISNRLLANIKRIAEITAELNSRSFSGIVLAELEKRARELSAFSSTSIEGNPLPLADVKRILKTRPEHIRDSEKEVLNYNKALVELNDSIKKEKCNFDIALLLKIQKTVTSGLLPDYRCGALRREPVFVNNPKTQTAAYLPPNHGDVPGLMDDLLTYIRDNREKIDPLILAGIFHKQFVIIHPFIDGNGRTTRLATKVLLANMGLNTFYLFSFENYYNKNVANYFKEVGVLGNYYDIKDNVDFTSWLEYFTDGIIDELLRVGKELQREGASPGKELKGYHRKIISYIEKHGYITDRDYATLTDRAKPTRNLDFRKLIEFGIIEKVGKGRATHYKFKIIR